jgi:hypothetical protein
VVGPVQSEGSRTPKLVDDDLSVLETAWPGTTIDGHVGIVSGTLSMSRSVNGQLLMNLAIGLFSGEPEDFHQVEFVMSREHAKQLTDPRIWCFNRCTAGQAVGPRR